MHKLVSGIIERGHVALMDLPWQQLSCGLFVFAAIVGMLAYRARLTMRPDARTPSFPKKRSVLHEKGDVSSSARPCATNSTFEYQLPDMLMMGCSNPYYYDQPGSTAPEDGPSDWKHEPMYVHPTAPDDLPIELWYPGDLPPKGNALQYAEAYDAQAQVTQAPVMGHTANISEYDSGVNLNGEGAQYGGMNAMNGLANMDQMAQMPEQGQMSRGSGDLAYSRKEDHIHAPVPIRSEHQQHSSWQKGSEESLTDLESVLFNDAHTQQRAPVINYTPPSEATGGGNLWNSPPDSFHAINSISSPHLDTTNSGNPYNGGSQMTQSPLLDFNMAYTEEQTASNRQLYVPAPLHMQKGHPYKIHKQQLGLHHAGSHHAHQHLLDQGSAVQPYNLPSPPHSARGSSESGSDTNEEHAFKCPHCSASFRIRGYLTRHMKKHAEIMKFNCPFYRWLDPEHKCHQTGGFSRRDTFKMHLKARHFAYPTGTARKNRPNCAGRCCGCSEQFENNEKWIETHLLAGECPMDKAYNSHDSDSSF